MCIIYAIMEYIKFPTRALVSDYRRKFYLAYKTDSQELCVFKSYYMSTSIRT